MKPIHLAALILVSLAGTFSVVRSSSASSKYVCATLDQNGVRYCSWWTGCPTEIVGMHDIKCHNNDWWWGLAANSHVLVSGACSTSTGPAADIEVDSTADGHFHVRWVRSNASGQITQSMELFDITAEEASFKVIVSADMSAALPMAARLDGNPEAANPTRRDSAYVYVGRQDLVTGAFISETAYRFGLPRTLNVPLPPDFVSKWGSVGSGTGQFSSPYSVATNAAGEVYVADAFNNRVQKFSRTGAFLQTWGSGGTGDGQFNAPTGIAVDASGRVFVTESGNRVQAFDANGAFLFKWGTAGSGDGQFNLPRGIAIDGDGYVYVVEQSNTRIQKFDSGGGFVRKWGSSGSGNGQFNVPWGIVVDGSGFVYVSETNNNRIQVFTRDGAFVNKWGTSGSFDGGLSNPRGLATDESGSIYVADLLHHRVQVFTNDGTFVSKWGTQGSGDGQFNQPQDVAVSANGDVYVADTGNQRIQRFGLNSLAAVNDPVSGRSLSLSIIPNPFSSSTRIALTIPRAEGSATVSVVDVTGRRIRTLYRGTLPAGPHQFVWDGKDNSGRGVGSGAYFVSVDGILGHVSRSMIRVQ